jgi:PAS domain S-box-containing protein
MNNSGLETQRERAARLVSRYWPWLAGLTAVVYLTALAGLVRLAGFSCPVLTGWLAGAATTAGLLYLLRQLAPPPRGENGPLSAEAFRAVAERYRNLAESIGEPFIVLDSQLRYQYFNAAAEQLLGKPAAAVLGKTPAEAFGESYSSQLQDHLKACRRVMQTGVPEVVTGAVSYDGRVKHLEVSIYPAREGGVLTINRDLTGQYDAEQQYRDLAESIADIFYALDREMRFTYWNKACERSGDCRLPRCSASTCTKSSLLPPIRALTRPSGTRWQPASPAAPSTGTRPGAWSTTSTYRPTPPATG